MNIVVGKGEIKEIILSEFSSLTFDVKENASLTLKCALFNEIKNISIKGNLSKNSTFYGVFADFSNGNGTVNADILLNDVGASAQWNLASLSSNADIKKFNVSFTHNAKKTNADMNNYGVALHSSRLIFSGTNHIRNGSIQSNSNQNAKIIVFDKESQGKANPILRIDENDVLASHAAVVGRLNDNHLFYLKSRGLTDEEAKILIVGGYLKPIAKHFSDDIRDKINSIIVRKCHV